LRLQVKRFGERIETLTTENKNLHKEVDILKSSLTQQLSGTDSGLNRNLLAQAVHILEEVAVSKPELVHNLHPDNIIAQGDLSILHTLVNRLVLALDFAEREERRNNDRWTTKQQEQKNRHKEIAETHNPFRMDWGKPK